MKIVLLMLETVTHVLLEDILLQHVIVMMEHGIITEFVNHVIGHAQLVLLVLMTVLVV